MPRTANTTQPVNPNDISKFPLVLDVPKPEEPLPYINNTYLPQHDNAYTSLTVVKLPSGEWVMRQVDIVNNKIIKTIDSKPNARAVCFEYFKVAAADVLYKEHY